MSSRSTGTNLKNAKKIAKILQNVGDRTRDMPHKHSDRWHLATSARQEDHLISLSKSAEIALATSNAPGANFSHISNTFSALHKPL